MADKKLQNLNNERTSVQSGDQFAIGGVDGFTYRANLNVLQDFLLENSLTASTVKAPQSAVVKTAIDAINTILTTDNASLDDFQKITDAIEAIQATLSVNDAAYDTLQKIRDKLKVAETKLATIATGAEVNVQADWNEVDNTSDGFIQNKPALGTASSKDVGTAIGNIQENGAVLGNSEIVETDSTGKIITAAKNTAYNANFGTGNTDVARGDASYSKADTYTQTEINNALATNSTDDRARANHTGTQAISTITGLQTALDAKEATANKGVAGGYASLDGSGQVPASQLPSVDLSDYFNKTTDTLDNVSAGATNKHFTATLETKLNGIDSGATANSTDAFLLARANHTGAQTLSTISDAGALAAKDTIATTDVDNNAITTAKIQEFASKSVVGRTSAGTGDVEEIDIATTLKADLSLTSGDVGLANVDNTSDADKPVSTAQQTALDGKLAKASNFSDVSNRQTALDNLTDVASATDEYVLTKDTTTGNALFKVLPPGNVPNSTETVAGIGEIATTAEAEAGTDNSNKFLNALKTKQAFDAFLPQKFDTLFSGAVSGGTFTLSKTLSQIISDYKFIISSFTTSIHRSTIAIPTQDLAISVTYEIGKFDTRYVNLDTPSSLSSAIFAYSSGTVSVSNAVVIGF